VFFWDTRARRLPISCADAGRHAEQLTSLQATPDGRVVYAGGSGARGEVRRRTRAGARACVSPAERRRALDTWQVLKPSTGCGGRPAPRAGQCCQEQIMLQIMSGGCRGGAAARKFGSSMQTCSGLGGPGWDARQLMPCRV